MAAFESSVAPTGPCRSEPGTSRYPSGVDGWLVVIMIGVPLTTIAMGVFQLGKAPPVGWVLILTGLGVAALMAALTIPCVYTLAHESLTIRCGLLVEEVPLRRIRSVAKSGSLWSAPALSLRRLRIDLDKGYRVISPKDRDGFIADLNARLARRRD